jgi:hypothetical protein
VVDEEFIASLREGAARELKRQLEFKDYAQVYAETMATAIMVIVDKREITLTAEQRERILGGTDLENYRRWLGATMTATSAEEIFN